MTFRANDPMTLLCARIGAERALALHGPRTEAATKASRERFDGYADPKAALRAWMLSLALKSAQARRARQAPCAWCAGDAFPRGGTSTICLACRRQQQSAWRRGVRDGFRELPALAARDDGPLPAA